MMRNEQTIAVACRALKPYVLKEKIYVEFAAHLSKFGLYLCL